MRLFFALELDRHSALAIADWRDRQMPGVGRAVPAANLHITLAFLGDIADHRLDRLCHSVDDYLERHPSAGGTLTLDTLGFWPKPRILWVGPGHWPEGLNQLAAGLGQVGTVHGGKRKRGAFRPHVTLFRGCEGAPAAPALPPGFTLDYRDFALMDSRQGRSGVSYHPLAHWRLA